MDASQLVNHSSVRIYEPPLSDYRDDGRICDTTRPLSVVMLLIDYETECSMNGIIGFLGNSTGRRLTETITAVRKIGCIDHAKVLEEIREAASAAGMTHDAIQDDRSDLQEFTVSSFADLHGDKWEDACDTIGSLHDNVDWDSFWKATLEFVRSRQDSILRDSNAH